MKEEKKKKTSIQKLAERLHDPLQFRIFVAVVALGIGYMGVYTPLSDQITETTQKLKQARELQNLNDQISDLRGEVNRVAARLPKNSDTNEWVQYILNGVRGMPVKLTNLDSAEPRQVGPFEAIVLRVELEGSYHDLETFLNWIETNQRLFRVDEMRVSMMRNSEKLEMALTLLGLQQ